MARTGRHRYLVLPLLVLVVTGVFWALGYVEGGLSVGEILNLVFVAVLVSITWFYADETAMLRTNAVEQLHLLEEAHHLRRARLAFRPVPAQPRVGRDVISSFPDLDTLEMGVEVVNAGGAAAINVRLSVLFYNAGLSHTSNGVTTHDSDREPDNAPTLILLPGESRTFSVPRYWKDQHYSASRLTARIAGSYEDAIGVTSVEETVDISQYMEDAARTRMFDYYKR